MAAGTGEWKEGRQGAASLWYGHLDEPTWAQVLERHAAVGIRASCSGPTGALTGLLRERNWDARPDPAWPCLPGMIARDRSSRPDELPAQYAPVAIDAAMTAIDAVVQAGAWAIWRIDAATLDAWGETGHRRLLSWLGDHHARIWCAPVADIERWM